MITVQKTQLSLSAIFITVLVGCSSGGGDSTPAQNSGDNNNAGNSSLFQNGFTVTNTTETFYSGIGEFSISTNYELNTATNTIVENSGEALNDSSYSYDNQGRVIQYTAPRQAPTAVSYNADGTISGTLREDAENGNLENGTHSILVRSIAISLTYTMTWACY